MIAAPPSSAARIVSEDCYCGDGWEEMKRSPSASPRARSQPLMWTRERRNFVWKCLYRHPRVTKTGTDRPGERSKRKIPLPVCTSWSIQMYSAEWIPFLLWNRLISLIRVEKTSICEARSPVKWGRKWKKETLKTRERKNIKNEWRRRRRARKSLCIRPLLKLWDEQPQKSGKWQIREKAVLCEQSC